MSQLTPGNGCILTVPSALLDPVSPVESNYNDFPSFSTGPSSETACRGPVNYLTDHSGYKPSDLEVPASMASRSTKRRHRQRRKVSLQVHSERVEIARELLNVFVSLWVDRSKKVQLLALRFRDGFEHRLKHCGLETALVWLKSESSNCRAKWILHKHDDFWSQASYLGRGLPKGGPNQVADALDKHYLALTEGFSTNEAILTRAKEFARQWGAKHLVSADRMASSGVPTLSSCCEATVRSGGLRGYASSLGEHADLHDLTSELQLELPPQDVASVSADVNAVLHGRDIVMRGVPPSITIALPERGLKVRIITKSSAGLHFLGHVVRKRLLRGLSLDPASQGPLNGLSGEKIIEHLYGALADTVVSTDLTSASDLLPLDLIKAVVDGLAESGRLPQMEIDALRLLTGPQEVIWPARNGAPEKKCRTARGILMGLPTTWSILSIIHLFWWRDSIDQARLEHPGTRKMNRLQFEKLNRFSICGDDAIFIGYRAVADRYSSLVRACGGKESSGKHFVTAFEASPRAVFLEKLYHFNCGGSNFVASAERDGSIPLKGLVRPEVPDAFRKLGANVSLSVAVRMLFGVDSIWTTHEAGLPRLLVYLRQKPWLYRFADSLGLPNGVHLSEGGSGLPIRTQLSRDTLRYRYSVALSRTVNTSVPSLVRGILDPTWQMAEAMVAEDIENFIMRNEVMYLEEGFTVSDDLADIWCLIGTEKEFMKMACEDMFISMSLQFGVQPGIRRRLRDSDLTKAVTEFKSQLTAAPEDWDPSWPLPDTQNTAWVSRTLAPNEKLVFPRWVGESKASDATLRAKLVAQAWGVGLPSHLLD